MSLRSITLLRCRSEPPTCFARSAHFFFRCALVQGVGKATVNVDALTIACATDGHFGDFPYIIDARASRDVVWRAGHLVVEHCYHARRLRQGDNANEFDRLGLTLRLA